MKRSVIRGLVALLAVWTLAAPTVSAHGVRSGLFGTAIRIEGYWDRSEDTDPDILGDLTFANRRGTQTRVFGTTAVRPFFRVEKGIHTFTDSLRSVFNVTGPKEVVDRFFDAPPNAKVIALGLYDASAGSLILSEVEIEGSHP